MDQRDGGWVGPRWWAVAVALAAALALRPAAADTGEAAGQLVFVDADAQDARATRLATDVTMRVSGMVARVTVTQRFRNEGAAWREGRYVFPLPEAAAVDRLRMTVGGRVVEGEVRPRADARRDYERARREGRRASLVAQERPNLFTASVANIGPGEAVTVRIGYRERVRFDSGRFSLRLPLTITPRFVPGAPTERPAVDAGTGWAAPTTAVPDAARVTPRMQPPSLPPSNPVRVEVTLDPGVPLAAVTSPSHAIRTMRSGDGRHRVSLVRERVPSDRDFVLRWRPRPSALPRAAVFTETVDGSRYAQLLVMPPSVGRDVALAREVVLVVDTSGSMKGASIRQARRALSEALARLRPQDRFNVIAFSDSAHRLFPAVLPATAANVADARRRVLALSAGGGTNIAAALDLALQRREAGAHLRQVVFITDGAVANEAALLARIQRDLGVSRLFTVGIGSAPNGYFMRKAAAFGRGSFTYVGSATEAPARMRELFRKLEHPAARDIVAEWPAGTRAYPDPVPDLYAGEPLVLTARLPPSPGTVRIRGNTGARTWRRTVDVTSGREAPGVAVLWARARVAALTDRLAAGADEAAVREAIVETALRHRLVTRYTSLVAVERTPARPVNEPLGRDAIPPNLPHGARVAGFTAAMPQTATRAGEHLRTGLGLLLMAAVAAGALAWRRFPGVGAA